MARERLLPTLTWHPKGLTQPWKGPAPHGPHGLLHHGASPGGCTWRLDTALLSVLPQPTKAPRLGSPSETHRPSDTDSALSITAGYFPHQQKLMMEPQAWGRVVKSSPEQLV